MQKGEKKANVYTLRAFLQISVDRVPLAEMGASKFKEQTRVREMGCPVNPHIHSRRHSGTMERPALKSPFGLLTKLSKLHANYFKTGGQSLNFKVNCKKR